MTNIEIAQLISERIGQSPVPHNDIRNISYEIYQELGGESELEDFEDIYELLLTILPMAQIIDDTSVRTDKTWSSYKINSELSTHYTKNETDNLLGGKQDTLTAGDNITINGNTISANDTVYSAGDNIDITNDTISAEGYVYNPTTGSFVEGDRNIVDELGTTYTKPTATGIMAHAEGGNSNASGNCSHTEGRNTTASGNQSHTEGRNTTASGTNSHAEGLYTKAQNYVEHAQGSYNNSHKTASNAASTWQGDGNHTLHSIGIGTANNARKNAVEVMQNGDVYVFGVGDYDGTKSKTQDDKVQTLQDVIDGIESDITDLNDFTCETIVPTTTNFVPGTEYTMHEALQRTANLFGGFQGEIDDINELIPNQATAQNQLADKAFVNSTVATNAANFRGNWNDWTSVPTDANQYPEDYVGNRTPTNNDYMVVSDASDYNPSQYQGSWRFIYVGTWATDGKNGWNPQYQIGTTFTASQQAAIDSGITSTKVEKYEGYNSKITALETDKLDKVYTASKIYGTNTLGQQTSYTAGNGIQFANDEISTSFDISNYLHQGSNNLNGDLKLFSKDGVSNIAVTDDHADLKGKSLHKDVNELFDRGTGYTFTSDRIVFQHYTTTSNGNIDTVTSEYKQTPKNVELFAEKVIVNPTSALLVNGAMTVTATDKTTKFNTNAFESKVQDKFTISDASSNKLFETKSGQTNINTRLDVLEGERGNTISLRKDAFETMVNSSAGNSNWMKMTAGGNPFAFGVANDPNFNLGVKTTYFNTLPDGSIYIYGVDDYDGITTNNKRSLQTVIEDLENNKQNVLTAGDNIDITNDTISAKGYNFNESNNSFSQGIGTQALNEAEHAEGTYNKSNNIQPIEYVDLNLPSGTLWAKCNLGATSETEFGDYYAWGEINTKTYYDWTDPNDATQNYKYANGAYNKLTKYCPTDKTDYWDGNGNPDNLTSLELIDDVVFQNIEGSWRMPTPTELQELIDETDNEWVENYNGSGVNGRLFTGTNGNTLFIPAAGFRFKTIFYDYDFNGGIWSSSLFTGYPATAYYLFFDSDGEISISNQGRYYGSSIRPVLEFALRKSEKQTIHSIGIGTSNEDRKNAVEVFANGSVYIKDIDLYNGTNPQDSRSLQQVINGKQDTLTAGNNITINGTTISATDTTYSAGDNIDITNNVIAARGYEYDATYNSITTGNGCSALGDNSHAEGELCVTSYGAYDSHAEGSGTTASGQSSHAEGDGTTASGQASHAEGELCVTGDYAVASHAEGVRTETTNINEHAQGRYNVSHSADVNETQHEGNTIVSVGIGEDGDSKNAFEIMQNGDIYIYGLGNYDGTTTKYDDSNIMTLQDILKKIADATGVDIGALF